MNYFARRDTPMELVVSLGSAISYIQHPASMTHAGVPEADRLARGITPGLVRVARVAWDLRRRGLLPLELPVVESGEISRVELHDLAGPLALDLPVELSGGTRFPEIGDRPYLLNLGPFAFYWFALERVRPYLLAIGPTITHVGPLGLAATMKVATNLGLAVQMLAFSEAVCLAEKAGIARERAVETLLKSVVASPMLKYRGPFVLGMPAEAWFNVPMIQKDLELALDLGHRVGVPLPTVALTQSMMNAARALGLGDQDFAVVFDVLARLSGLPDAAKAAR